MSLGGKVTSTSWMYCLKKADLERELVRVGLPISGTTDALRRVLRYYIRAHPQEYQPVQWVFQCTTDVLKEELRDVNLSDDGDWGQLVLRFADYVRSHLADYPAEGSGETSRSGITPTEQYKPISRDIVRKWNIKFGPKDSVFTFLERIVELKAAYNIRDEDMLKFIPEVLKESVLLWYRNNASSWSTWEEFIVSFKEQYLPLDVDDALLDEIRLRTQGADEYVTDYVTSVQTLMRRLNIPLQTSQQTRMLIKNLRPDVRLFIKEAEVTSVQNLVMLGKEFERLSLETQRYKPPPKPSHSFCKETAYVGRQSHNRSEEKASPMYSSSLYATSETLIGTDERGSGRDSRDVKRKAGSIHTP